MTNIFETLGQYFKPNKQNEIEVIGFYTQSNELFIYNNWDDKFDNFNKIDLAESAFKYKDSTMIQAQVCMKIEGLVGDLQKLSLFI
jgi:hypothetical protein